VPKGRQCLFLAVSMVFCHGSSTVPSGVVPGGGEVLVRELIWTRSISSLGCPGPLWKIQGLICNFLYPLDLFVRCTDLILI
jgi:hypothetical protein